MSAFPLVLGEPSCAFRAAGVDVQQQLLGEYEEDDRSTTTNEIANIDTEIREDEISDDDVFITVVKGDTLYSIAKKNNLSVDDVKRINGLDSNELNIGMKLLVTK